MSRLFPATVVVLAVLCLASVPCAIAQTAKPAATAAKPAQTDARTADAKAEVPALDAMHAVIMPMWHDAYPKKDVKALAGLLPEIEKYISAIEKADLPGILREKASAWAVGVTDLKKAGAGYKAAVASGKTDNLLKAAEALHSTYEALVKVIRPVLAEMDDFHATLYVLYHTQLNPLVIAKATESITVLQNRMAALNKATVPDKLKARTDAFVAQRTRLAKALDAVSAAMAGKNEMKIAEAIELMHVEYQKLERVFE